MDSPMVALLMGMVALVMDGVAMYRVHTATLTPSVDIHLLAMP
jgi:hypothetical protein